MVSYKTALKNFFKKGFNFKGRSTRAEYWWIVLTFILVDLFMGALLFIGLLLAGAQGNFFQIEDNVNSGAPMIIAIIWTILMMLILLIFVIPFFALQVRRYRDTDLAEPLVWVAFIVIILGSMVASFFSDQNAGMEVLSNVLSILTMIISILPTDCFKNINWLNRKN